MKEFKYELHDDVDCVIEEKGNTFIALRKISWNGGEPRLDLRKWFSTSDGEKMSKGVSLFSDEGADELVRVLISLGYGNTHDILREVANRENIDIKEDATIEEYFDISEFKL